MLTKNNWNVYNSWLSGSGSAQNPGHSWNGGGGGEDAASSSSLDFAVSQSSRRVVQL